MENSANTKIETQEQLISDKTLGLLSSGASYYQILGFQYNKNGGYLQFFVQDTRPGHGDVSGLFKISATPV